MATTLRPSTMPKIIRPLCPSTVETGNPGISLYSMAKRVSILSAKPPKPVPRMTPTSGAKESVAASMKAAVFLISSNIFFQFLQKIRSRILYE